MHLPQGLHGPLAVVIGMAEPLRPLVVPELEVGHVDVEDAVEELQRLDGIVPAGVVDQRDIQPALDGRDQRFEDLRDDVARGDEVDVVAPAPGQVKHDGGELARLDLLAFPQVADIIILAKSAKEIAGLKKTVPEPCEPTRGDSSP